jgi:spermidine synthase
VSALPRPLLPATVFITGACVLVVEVLAVRILSPYYGNSIFTVSSVLSVVLLALSVGYYAGGVLADRRPTLVWFFGIILASGLLLIAFDLLGQQLLPALSERLSLEAGPLVSSALLFLLPALFLGTLSPYAIKLQSLHAPEQGVGRISGQIFFWSTVGSITGSLLAGFVLVPAFGVDRILIGTGLLLCALGVVPLVALGARGTAAGGSLVVAALVIARPWLVAVPATEGETVVHRSDGVYQQITVYEGAYYGRPARFLLLDRSESGAMFLDSDDPKDLVYDYTKYYALYKIFTPRLRQALVLGGGAYSIPKALLAEAPDVEVDVAEIEPSFFGLAQRYFGTVPSPRLRNHVQDGRRFLQDAPRSYDLIFGDVYYSYFSVPPQFTTHEFFALAKARLNPEGVFIANMIGDLSRREPSLIMAELKTFQEVFPNSYFFAVDAVDKVNLVQNITLVGFNSSRRVDVTAPPVTTHPDELIRFLRFKALDVDRRFELSSYPVLTDDYSPVEYLTARVLARSLDRPEGIAGEEIRALFDQLQRYDARSAAQRTGAVRQFLEAELAVLAQETRIEGATVVGSLFQSEPRRVALAVRYDRSPSGVAMLVELMRVLIASPVAPTVGVDVVFLGGDAAGGPSEADGVRALFEGAEAVPERVLMVEEEFRDDLKASSAESLARAASALLASLTGGGA